MQSAVLLIAASSLFQGPAARVTPDTTSSPAWASLAPTPRFVTGNRLGVAAMEPSGFGLALSAEDSAQGQRPKAREYSSAFYTRLTIHKYASYATLPLFAAEYVVGQKLFNDSTNSHRGLRGVHSGLALGIGALFAVNTVTGVWNLWDQRKESDGRARRYLHAILMLASDAGFLATAATAPDDDRRNGSRSSGARDHRTLAIASFSTATVGYLMMLIWK